MNLRDWTSYYSVGGVYTEDKRHEDVMVLLEAVRPRDIQKFLQHELDVCPADKVHVSILLHHWERKHWDVQLRVCNVNPV